MMKMNFCLLLALLLARMGSGNPVHGSQESDEDNGADSDNSISDLDTRVVDLNNLDPAVLEQLQSSNINLTALRLKQASLRAKKLQQDGYLPSPAPLTQLPVDTDGTDLKRKEYEESAIDNIKNIIHHSLIRNASTTAPTNVVTHEVAFPATCDLPRTFNETAWTSGNAWNLFFRVASKNVPLTSAVLRLFKLREETLSNDAENCTDQTDQLLRVTVSVYSKRSKIQRGESSLERRKRLCSSQTVSRKYKGWIELDIKLAVKQWEKANRNFGLAVEVQDMEDNYLRARDFFHPLDDCSQAARGLLPWNFFEHSLAYSSRENANLPHVPRVDVMWTTGPLISHVQRRNFHHFSSRPVRHSSHHSTDYLNAASTTSSEQYSSEVASLEELHSVAVQKQHKKRHLLHRLTHRNSQERLRSE